MRTSGRLGLPRHIIAVDFDTYPSKDLHKVMSLYYEAADLIAPKGGAEHGSLKSRLFQINNSKAPSATIYALIHSASKWSAVLTEVVEKSSFLTHERKLTPALAILLVHDLLLTKKGIAAPTNHPLRLSTERHKARLHAELTKARLRRNFSSLDALRKHMDQNTAMHQPPKGKGSGSLPHPRWVRVNTLKSTLKYQLETTFLRYRRVGSLQEILESSAANQENRIYYVDAHVPNLLAFPPGSDLLKLPAYRNGILILQDKASCFPAYLLNPQPGDGDVIDACAAPGNKSTHLAAILESRATVVRDEDEEYRPKVWACELNKARGITLSNMLYNSGASEWVVPLHEQDFTRLDPNSDDMRKVGTILLDPSCSGSGIVGRDDPLPFELPTRDCTNRSGRQRYIENDTIIRNLSDDGNKLLGPEARDKHPLRRLEKLSTFQRKLLLHAFSFPSARKVTYSTCSIHDEENEHVVLAALESQIAKERGWKILRREGQVEGMKRWHIRGKEEACGTGPHAAEIAAACIRCKKATEDGTQGFFVVAFIRASTDDVATSEKDIDGDEEEWKGFGD